MSFEKMIRIPTDRIGALIGKSGKVKSKIEKKCSVKLEIDSKTGETLIRGTDKIEDILPLTLSICVGDFPTNSLKSITCNVFSPFSNLIALSGEKPRPIAETISIALKG